MEEILVIDDSKQICDLLANYVLPELGYQPVIANTGRQGLHRLHQHLPDLILLDLQLPDISGLELLRVIAQEGYDVPVILMTAHGSENIAVEAFRLGARNYLIKPFSDTEARMVIDQALREQRLRREKEHLMATLQQRVQELTVLSRIGKSVTMLMDQEKLLERIVEAGVFITRAEEGFLLLHDPRNNELYLCAAKNLGEQRAQSLRMPIADTLAGQVVRTGQPIRLDKSRTGAELKVKTGFLVHSLLQVPLTVGTNVIGVLAVDNQQSERAFNENDQYLLATLADYAAIAIENARWYTQARQSEARYRDLFKNAYDLIFMLDRDLRVTSINNVGQELMGYSQSEFKGMSLADLCTPESWDSARLSIAELLAGRRVPPFELAWMTRDGEHLYLEVSARPMPMPNGAAPSGLHCIARNLTERRRLEEQLVQSEKLSAIGQLVAGVAHELNNPLTSISGYAQLLMRDKSMGEDSQQDVHQIYTQAERAARIVRNLLIFAREHRPERVAVNLNEVLRATLSLQAYQLRVDNIKVVTHFDPHLPVTIADPNQLQQVFLNLIGNAHQAMAETRAGGTLTLLTRYKAAQHAVDGDADQNLLPDVLEVAVSDTGIGIPEHNLKRIFDPFFTTKPVGKGTGLGLSICFGIVREHDGRIWAESTVGEGTTVHVELPLRTQSSPDTGPLPELPRGDSVDVDDDADFVINALVVDDEEPVGVFLERLLNDLGHHSHVVDSGEAALQVLDYETFDVIMTDVKMPGMNGFELYYEILQRDPELAQRVVFITGDTLSQETQSQLDQIGNPSVQKPFSIDHLGAMLQNLVKRKSVHLGE